MSCQQASRFITTATTTVATATAKSTATKRIVTTTAQTPPAAKTSTATAKITTKTTPTASKVDVVDVENIGVAAKTNTIEDPYVFTETITATPPILFNAQKSRARLSEAQHSRNNKKNNNKQRVANKKSSIVAATTAAAAAAHNAQLNGTAVAATTTTATAASAKPAAEVAITKALASLGAAAASTTTTTNFNNVTQSQRQPASQQLQLQSPLQLQSQALPKRATNVCVVRPQQQQQQQQQQLKQQAKLITKHAAPHPPPPPPLYTHTPSLWQTPLILDTTQKQQQQQQQQQQTNIVVATALVSSPTSPASLPSPTASSAPPTAAVTAMVSPIVSPATMSPPKGGSLPPSKFHHTTLAQHFAKVECLKKKKSLPLACQNSNNNTIAESLHKTKTTQVPRGKYSLTHPPPLTVFNTTTTTPAAAAAATTAMNKHSADAALDDNNDLNEIPVNVIFRKPPELLAGQIPPSSVDANLALKLGAVAPITPPTPLQLPLAANAVCPQLPVATTTTTTNAPALITQPAVIGAAAPIASIQNEQMSSKVANSAASVAAVPKRKTTPAGSTSARKGNKQIVKNSAQEASPSPPQQHQTKVAVSSSPAPPPSQSEVPARRRKATAPASKRNALLFTENEPLEQDVPYCLQKHWLPADASRQLGLDQPASVTNNRDREERIAMRKGLLRHQALQLLSTRTLQELPLRAARQRLQSVQGLLLKYRDTASLQQGIGVGNRCLVAACKQPTLSMAAHCERHIVHNTTQQLFQPCLAWRVDGTACQAPVFDVLHTLALCPAHSHLRSGLELQSKKQLQQQQVKPAPTPAVTGPIPAVASTVIATAVAGKRKRKTNPNANPVGRPQKRVKKPEAITPTRNTTTTLPARPPMSAVMQRKSSTTSLESIASNSQSSAMSHSALPPYTPTAPMLAMPQLSIIPPALAPISDQLQLQLLQPKIEPEQQLDTSVNLLANASFKADEISQIVAQLAAASSELHHNNNSLHYNNNNNSITYSSNNNSNSGSSSISCGFPSFNAAFGNAMSGQQQQIGGQLSCNNTTLDSTESLLSQHMFGICENSSAYASSEDTGLGGLSESELIGANDAGDIALNGAHLLEEHDLVNVFDTLPDDAFNELFQSVQQADCEAMDRALEIADKNLKCLQQTIGSTDHDSAFLSDLLDVGDDLLVNAVTSVMNSPNTSGIDAAALFVDSSGGGNSSSNGALGSSPAASVADIRGLVQT